MLRPDLERAGIPFVDELGRRLDFHALRAQCATDAIRGKADPFSVQELMRHSKIETTLKHYDKLGVNAKQAAALAAMPDLDIRTA